jgi:hypothetical protein
MKARTAVVELLKTEPEWRSFFKQCCATSPRRHRSQVRQWQDELTYRGHAFELADVEDSLADLARRFFPESPGAQWDAEYASEMCKGALARLAEHYAGLTEAERDRLDLSGQDPHEEAMNEAGEQNDPAAFRLALSGWERAGLEAFDALQSTKGAVA